MFPAAKPTPAQIAAMSFRWFQMRSSSTRNVRVSQPGRRPEPAADSIACAYASVCATWSAGARPPDEADTLALAGSLRRRLQTAMLVEQAQVEMKDALAHDVEAKVTAFDYAGMDRSHRNVVWPVPVNGDDPVVERGGMVD